MYTGIIPIQSYCPLNRDDSGICCLKCHRGLTVLFIELVAYLPIGVVERASLNNGLNYVADTLMFAGAVLLLAGAMPRAVRL